MSKENEILKAIHQNLLALCNYAGQKGYKIDRIAKDMDSMKMSIGRLESRQLGNAGGGV